MIAALMNQKYRNGSVLRDHEIAHIMIALLMAGQHTSSASGSWALLHIAANPDIAYVLSLFQVSSSNSDSTLLIARVYTKSSASSSARQTARCGPSPSRSCANSP